MRSDFAIVPEHRNYGNFPSGDEMIYANVTRGGVITFEPHADLTLATLPVGYANNRDAVRFRDIVEVNARRAYDGKTLLVPGIPEANNDDEALIALKRFRKMIEWRIAGKKGWPK